jgi:NAD(P)-dependent dehydrogenase (short-subunit alcohol dehydrogenase family)
LDPVEILLLIILKRGIMITTSPRIAVVTGANKGIGFYIALQLGLSGQFSHIILGCRDPALAASASHDIQKQVSEKV